MCSPDMTRSISSCRDGPYSTSSSFSGRPQAPYWRLQCGIMCRDFFRDRTCKAWHAKQAACCAEEKTGLLSERTDMIMVLREKS